MQVPSALLLWAVSGNSQPLSVVLAAQPSWQDWGSGGSPSPRRCIGTSRSPWPAGCLRGCKGLRPSPSKIFRGSPRAPRRCRTRCPPSMSPRRPRSSPGRHSCSTTFPMCRLRRCRNRCRRNHLRRCQRFRRAALSRARSYRDRCRRCNAASRSHGTAQSSGRRRTCRRPCRTRGRPASRSPYTFRRSISSQRSPCIRSTRPTNFGLSDRSAPSGTGTGTEQLAPPADAQAPVQLENP